MIDYIKIYMKNHAIFLMSLIFFLILPLFLFFKFSPYPLPNVEYVFLIALFFYHLKVFDHVIYRKKHLSSITDQLSSELGKHPSTNQIETRVSFIIEMRSHTVILCAALIIFLMIFFDRF